MHGTRQARVEGGGQGSFDACSEATHDPGAVSVASSESAAHDVTFPKCMRKLWYDPLFSSMLGNSVSDAKATRNKFLQQVQGPHP